MTVIADASRLLSRLNQMMEAVKLAPYALSDVAVETIGEVSNTALERLSGREDQVGFDLAQFLRNISQPGHLIVTGAQGTVGILDQDMMGTAEDFERIGDIAPDSSGNAQHLWHQHGRRGDAFRRAVFDYPDVRAELARDRQSVWGDRTPQWYLLENGSSTGGEYPAVPASHFIASTTRADRMVLKLRNAMTSLFRGIPRS